MSTTSTTAKSPLHTKKFMGGRITPNEMHAMFAFPQGAKCACGAPPQHRAIVMASVKDAVLHQMLDPKSVFDQEFMRSCIVPLQFDKTQKPEHWIRLSATYCCDLCRPTMEKELAKLPSWVLVELSKKPNPTEAVSIALTGV